MGPNKETIYSFQKSFCCQEKNRTATPESDRPVLKPTVPPLFPHMIRVGSSCLPAELADRIIDFCHDHKRTLLSCALTHSSWLPTSRLHLFHTITSFGETRTTRAVELKSIINNTPISVSRRWPSILAYIKIVKIASSRSDRLANATYLAHAIRGFCSSRRLPSPSVHVSLSRFKSSQGVLLSLLNDTITHVELLNVTFTPGNDVWPFLSSLSRLQHLALSATEANEPSGYDLPTGTAFEGIPLSTLRMTTASMGFVVSSIIKIAGSLPQLEDFGIFYEDIRQEGLPQLADAIQRTVKCLRFSASCYPGDWRDTESRPSGSDISEKSSPYIYNPGINDYGC